MLVHIVEEGLAESAEAELLVRHYLGSRPEIDSLILGCTHYPLLRGVLERAVGAGVTLVDSADATAATVSAALAPAPQSSAPGRVVHFVAGGVEGEIVPLPVTELAPLVQQASLP